MELSWVHDDKGGVELCAGESKIPYNIPADYKAVMNEFAICVHAHQVLGAAMDAIRGGKAESYRGMLSRVKELVVETANADAELDQVAAKMVVSWSTQPKKVRAAIQAAWDTPVARYEGTVRLAADLCDLLSRSAAKESNGKVEAEQ